METEVVVVSPALVGVSGGADGYEVSFLGDENVPVLQLDLPGSTILNKCNKTNRKTHIFTSIYPVFLSSDFSFLISSHSKFRNQFWYLFYFPTSCLTLNYTLASDSTILSQVTDDSLSSQI